jgi:hypothetical protein
MGWALSTAKIPTLNHFQKAHVWTHTPVVALYKSECSKHSNHSRLPRCSVDTPRFRHKKRFTNTTHVDKSFLRAMNELKFLEHITRQIRCRVPWTREHLKHQRKHWYHRSMWVQELDSKWPWISLRRALKLMHVARYVWQTGENVQKQNHSGT